MNQYINMVYDTLDKVVDYIKGIGWTLDKRYNNQGIFTLIQYPNKRMVYVPQPTFSPLFRGQSSIYESCFSSLYRDDINEVEYFIERLKLVDFEFLLQKHPIVQEELQAEIHVDYIGFAQHYGIKTELLDLTNSLIVAAFFATTKYTSEGKYVPIIDSNEKGIIYFIPPHFQLPNNSKSELELFPLGLQCFKRPGEQRAFSINLKNKKDLNEIPGIFKFKFYQDKHISEQIFNALDSGNKIFPYDAVERKVQEINQLTEFSRAVFKEAYTRYKQDVKLSESELLEILISIGINITNNNRLVNYSEDEIAELKQQKENNFIFKNNIATTRLCYIPKNNRP